MEQQSVTREEKPAYNHHKAYMDSVNAIASGAEKLLKICNENDGGIIPGNEEGPYVKLSVSMFCLRLASNLYWHTSKPPSARDEDDECDDENCPEHGPKVRMRAAVVPASVARQFDSLMDHVLDSVGAPAPTADDPNVLGMVGAMSPEERAKLMDVLQNMANGDAEQDDTAKPVPAPLPPKRKRPPQQGE